jgi:hypothetical protein
MPLAHILAPQIAKKTAEIEEALAPVGYLQQPTTDDSLFRQNVAAAGNALPGEQGRAFAQGYYKGSVGEYGRQAQDQAQREIAQFRAERAARGLSTPQAQPPAAAPPEPTPVGYLRMADAPAQTASEAALQRLRAESNNSPFQTFKNAAVLGAAKESRRQKGTMLLPNAPVAEDPRFTDPGAPIGVHEDGSPAYSPGKTWNQFYNDPKNDPRKRGRAMIKLPKGAVGIDETGQAVDKKGKRLGYLNHPAMVTPTGDTPLRGADRRPSDIIITKDAGLADRDMFGAQHLQKTFGKHLKAMQENRDENGMPTDKFPADYFKGMSKDEREKIIYGVRALQMLDQGVRT